MGKKKQEEGAPAYFGLYASLMTVLLAFFILLVTMAPTQDGGFQNGIGDVRDAFGFTGGFGLLPYARLLRRHHASSVPEEMRDADGLPGIHEDQLKGDGGSGNNDADLDEYQLSRYIRLELPDHFEPDSTVIPEEMARYLQLAGTGFALLECQVSIRCYTAESGDDRRDRVLAARRGTAIMRYLNRACRIPFSRLRATGYADSRYFRAPADNEKQIIYIDIFDDPDANT